MPHPWTGLALKTSLLLQTWTLLAQPRCRQGFAAWDIEMAGGIWMPPSRNSSSPPHTYVVLALSVLLSPFSWYTACLTSLEE